MPLSIQLESLRQQIKKADGQPNISLTDFIAPADSNKQDYIGAFSVTIEGIEKHIKRFEAALDDYNKISCRHWQTGWRKPLQKCCTKKCAKNTGAMLPMNIYQ